MLSVASKLGIAENDYEAWYKVSNNDLFKVGARPLLEVHKKSLSTLLAKVFPEHKWDLAQFPKKPKTFWSNPENRRAFAIEIGKKLGIKEGDYWAWYNVQTSDIRRVGGRGFLDRENASLIRALTLAFPEHSWDPARFIQRRKQFWIDPQNQRRVMEAIRTKLGISLNEMKAWYTVTYDDIVRCGGSSLIRLYDSSPSKLIMAMYPDHKWSTSMFRRGTSKTPMA